MRERAAYWSRGPTFSEVGACPGCNMRSTRRHSRYIRSLLDLPVQGSLVTVKLHTSRWRCLNDECDRQTFSEQLSDIARPYARQTERVVELIRLFGHGVRGRPAERLMKRLGLPTSDDTILRPAAPASRQHGK
ncbi:MULTISPECIES: transposase family protein [unclassified Methylosinus]|uniref:transposase family protein n=1 Tax=unclassified Methylosinus TaxID=2624500 RepID=UPI002477CBFC|nr:MULTISPECIES: transposase family protein [unclassified Methylosinus]